MRSVERESFLKSFALFFISLTLLAGMLFYFQFSKEKKLLDETLLTQMRLCSFNLTCKEFSIDTIQKKLIISDSGYGIKNPKKIFHRFYTEHSQGMGIGLHIVKKLCDEMNIDISVSSKEKEGSKFTLSLKVFQRMCIIPLQTISFLLLPTLMALVIQQMITMRL